MAFIVRSYVGKLCVALFCILVSSYPLLASDLENSQFIDTEQTLILVLHGNNKEITIKSSFLKSLRYSSIDYKQNHIYSLISGTNKILYSGSFPDPLKRWVDDFSEPDSPKGGQESIEEAEFMLKVPYISSASRIHFARKDDQGNLISLGEAALPEPIK